MNCRRFILLQLSFSKIHQAVRENGAYLLFPVTRLDALVKSCMIGIVRGLYYNRPSPFRVWFHRYVDRTAVTCDMNIS